jgi:hypothetical protein
MAKVMDSIDWRYRPSSKNIDGGISEIGYREGG